MEHNLLKLKMNIGGIVHQVIYVSLGRKYISRTIILDAKHEPYYYVSASKDDACAKVLIVKPEDLY